MKRTQMINVDSFKYQSFKKNVLNNKNIIEWNNF